MKVVKTIVNYILLKIIVEWIVVIIRYKYVTDIINKLFYLTSNNMNLEFSFFLFTYTSEFLFKFIAETTEPNGPITVWEALAIRRLIFYCLKRNRIFFSIFIGT